MILAFVGGRCVGAGKVDKFRKDLLEAKLGDGYCGFDFAINLNGGENLGAVVVKLQNADAALIQHSTRLIGPDDDADANVADLGAITPASVLWMQDRGLLEQQEYDFLKAVQGIGAYERGLRAPRRAGTEIPAAIKPETVATDLLGLYMLGDVELTRGGVGSLSELAGDRPPAQKGAVSVLGLWASERVRICLDERSHLGPRAGRGKVLTEAPAGGIDYSFGPDRILFLHRDCSFAPQGASPVGGITVFTATTRAAKEKPRQGEPPARQVKAA